MSGTCRMGPARRCPIWSATVLAGENDAIASVVRKRRTSTPSARTTTAIVVSGSALSSTSASTTPKCAAPVLPTTAPRLSATVLAPSLPAAARTARAWLPVTTATSTWSGFSSQVLSAAFQARSAMGTYTVSPKRSSHRRGRGEPGVRQRSTNSSVSDAPPRYSAITGPWLSSPTSRAAPPSPPSASSALNGRPPLMPATATSTSSTAREAARKAPTPERTAPFTSMTAIVGSRRSAAWIALALVFSA